MTGAALLGLVVALVAVIIVVLVLSIPVLRGRRLGTRGIVQRSHLVCPRCREAFDYDWIPGASFTAVRLGKGRYMACPLCHQWSYFNIWNSMVARPADASPAVGPR